MRFTAWFYLIVALSMAAACSLLKSEVDNHR